MLEANENVGNLTRTGALIALASRIGRERGNGCP